MTPKNIALSLIFFYIISYLLLSIAGKYEDNFSTITKIVGPCPCLSDSMQWQPAFTLFARGGQNTLYANSLGRLYAPLVIADQRVWHPTTKIVRHEMTKQELQEATEQLNLQKLRYWSEHR